jgi:hypothetical protein
MRTLLNALACLVWHQPSSGARVLVKVKFTLEATRGTLLA